MEEEQTQVELEQPEQQANETDIDNPEDGIALSTDDLGAAMGYMTTLGDQHMQTMMPEEEVENEEETKADEGQEPEETEEPQNPEEMKEDLKNELLAEMKPMLKETLKELLDEEE